MLPYLPAGNPESRIQNPEEPRSILDSEFWILDSSSSGGWFHCRCFLRHLRRVSLENSRRRELPQLVTHHVLGDVNRDEFLSVVNRNGQPDNFRIDRGPAGPGFNSPSPAGASVSMPLF